MIFVNGHKVSQVICLHCFRRWIAARPVDTRLDELECPDCHQQDIAIETGETSVAEELLKQMKEQENCENCAIAIEDRQPIVRCKDCKWYDERISMCDNCGLPREQIFFCADGERHEVAEHK